jgi:signal transduction histidine kinase
MPKVSYPASGTTGPVPGPDHGAAAVAARQLARLRSQIDEARASLNGLRRELAPGGDHARGSGASSLVEANEGLVLRMVRAEVDAETAARDIAFREMTTELRLESQRLGEENRLMVEASRLKNLFLANMSHELRTPLNAIMGFSEILRTSASPALSPEHLEYLDHIRDSGRHLLEIVKDVLDLTKVAAGQLDFHPEAVNLAQVVHEVVDMLHAAASRKAVVVCTEIEPGLRGLVLDRSRL